MKKVEDTGQDIIVERCEVFQRIHNRNNEVVVPLDLRQHLINNNKRDRGRFNITNHRKDMEFKLRLDIKLIRRMNEINVKKAFIKNTISDIK